MHIADPKLGIFGANGIVAAGLPIAVGAATAAQLRADGSVVVAFFGDGAVAQGAFHEAVNLAAVWRLPVIFFCENNGYAEFSPASTQHAAPLERPGRRLRRSTTSRSTATTSRRRPPRWTRWSSARPRRAAARSSSRPPPTAGTATTRATRSGTGSPDEVRALASSATRWSSHARGSARRGVGDDEINALESSVRATSSTTPSRPPGGSRARRRRR